MDRLPPAGAPTRARAGEEACNRGTCALDRNRTRDASIQANALPTEQTGESTNSFLFKQPESQNRFGSVDRALACGLKGHGFDSGQGHVPWLRAHPQ
jgi:hypothetical protein